MKRILLFAAVAGAALASCVKNESESGMTASDSKISFEAPVVGATTRAVSGEINGAYPTTEKFKVWGWYHEGDYTTFGDTQNNGWKNYMTDADGKPIEVAYDGTSSWAPAKDYFWPKNGKLTFVSLYGLEGSRKHAQLLIANAQKALDGLKTAKKKNLWPLYEMAEFFKTRTY